jgi:indolepyruvate ferredoxin oxidoreductase
MALPAVTLDEKYTKPRGRVFLTGIQALVRLPMLQRERDLAAGRNTAGYISGYRGSPLGGLDQQLAAARSHLDAHHIKFQPGVNEDLAATACWGTQQAGLTGEGKYDGVFAMWYGKGPGVDRTGDVFRHANLAGTAPHGGVLVLLGDDHTAESSTAAHQSEYAMVDAMIPILNPAGMEELIDYGLHGWALSRFSGCWVALKCMHETVNIAASIDLDPARVEIALPEGFVPPPGGLNIRWPDDIHEEERRLHGHKHDAVRAYVRANKLDRLIWPAPGARIGIITTGKSYLDLRQALENLGIDGRRAEQLGLRLYKAAMPFPLEPHGARDFARGLDLVIVVEEKRGLMETQLKEILYGSPSSPRIIGKNDEEGRRLFFAAGALDVNQIAATVGRRLLQGRDDPLLKARTERAEELSHPVKTHDPIERRPYFCAGCPHNTSTRIPEGARGGAGIGCHFMALWMDRGIVGFTQMGGEGANWLGESAFSQRQHIFQNLGDGTYYHSGLMAIRAAVASGANITYKILYNDAVAMTGGQHVDGPLSVPQISRQVAAEGVLSIAVVSDEPHKYPSNAGFAPGVTIHHRDELDAVQRRLATVPGTTALIYDQTCAAEKRRRRKRGRFPDPAKRAVINEAVCEGCGDCGVKSNCVAVLPLETEFGRKRMIDQSACNKDFSCVEGFCPSFVTVHGGKLRRGKGSASGAAPVVADLPEPSLPPLDRPYAILVTGVGGTGIVTIGALLGMAAHLEGKGCGSLDMTGLAQKGGAVTSHVRIARSPAEIGTVRIAAGGADLLLGGDLVVSGGHETLHTLRADSHAVVNSYELTTGDFTRNADLAMPGDALRGGLEDAVGPAHVDFIDATRLATALLGDSIATNLFMLGYAYQRGLVPVSAEAILGAIEINAAAVEMNKQAFHWGRRAALDRAAIERIAYPQAERLVPKAQTLEELVARRVAFLVEYQDAAYAQRYRTLVERVRAAEAAKARGRGGLAEAVARYYFKLLAYKDEYEVARLYTNGKFMARIREQFEGGYRLHVHLAPPLLARRDPLTGEPKKREYGPWMLRLFGLLAPLRRLRGTPLDVFGYSAERRLERALIADYEQLVERLIAALDDENHKLAIELASLPEHIRGFGHIKARSIETAKTREAELLGYFMKASAPVAAAE